MIKINSREGGIHVILLQYEGREGGFLGIRRVDRKCAVKSGCL